MKWKWCEKSVKDIIHSIVHPKVDKFLHFIVSFILVFLFSFVFSYLKIETNQLTILSLTLFCGIAKEIWDAVRNNGSGWSFSDLFYDLLGIGNCVLFMFILSIIQKTFGG